MVAAKSEDEEIISDSVSYLIELAESYPKMFRSVLANVCPLMLGIMSNKELEPGESFFLEGGRGLHAKGIFRTLT